MAMRILVTGGAGMLGGHLIRQLARDGYEVYSLDVDRVTEPVTGVRYTIADVRDESAMRQAAAGTDAIVHCASALPSYPAREIRSIVHNGMVTVLRAAAGASVSRVVHLSSTAVYGLPEVVPTTEAHPLRPVDTYGRAKVAAEQECERFRADGMCVPVLRPKTFVGPGRMGLFAMLFEWAQEGRHFPVLGRGDVRVQMCAVEDLVEAVIIALNATPTVANDTFNIAAADFGTLRDDFQAVLDAAGHGRRLVSIPAGPAVLLLKLLRSLRLSPVYQRLPHKLLADSYVSTEKARERLGFIPRYSNQEALLRAFLWWRSHGRASVAGRFGRTSRDAWRQGALRVAKAFF